MRYQILDESLLTSHSSPKARLGQRFVDGDGKCYVYVKRDADDSNTVAEGTILCRKSATTGYANAVMTVASTKRNFVIGVATGSITAGEYAAIQIKGVATVNTNGDDDISAGDTIIMANGNGVCDSVAAGTASTYKPIGIALADDSDDNNTVSVMLDIDN